MTNEWRHGNRLPIGSPDPVHVVPEFKGEPEHEASKNCWCEPKLERGVYVHQRPQ